MQLDLKSAIAVQSGTQQRCAISSAIALADCTWLLDIGDRRMRIGDVQNPASDFCAKPQGTQEGNAISRTAAVRVKTKTAGYVW